MKKAALAAALLGSVIVAPNADATSIGPFVFFFDFDSARVTPQAEAIVANFAGFLDANPHIAGVGLHGHTDRAGSPRSNRRLSCRRAAAVRASLIARGISADRMVMIGWGEEKPLVDTPDGVAEAQNRRVEIGFGILGAEQGSKPYGPVC